MNILSSPLLVVLPYHVKDAPLAKQLLEYIRDESDTVMTHRHPILLAADSTVPKEVRLDMKELAAGIFRHANSMTINVEESKQSWPQGPNVMFFEAARQVLECYRLPFLWLEPDATPLHRTWLDRIAEVYHGNAKRFMGTFVTVTKDGQPKQHMAGTGVYPNDAFSGMAEPIRKCMASGDAFDFGCAEYVMPRAYNTDLIHEIFGSHSEVPTFKKYKSPEDAGNVLTPAVLRPGAVLFHRVKDGSLMCLLQQKAKDDPKNTVESTLPDPEPGYERMESPGDTIVVEKEIPKKKQRIGVPESKMATI